MPQGPKIAIIGMGRWGKKLIQAFNKEAFIAVCAHRGNAEEAAWLKENFSNIAITTDINDILSDPSIEAVVVATPIATHFDIARRVLEAGKHAFIEKPVTEKLSDAESLIILSDSAGKTLFVGHVFIYHPVLEYIQKNIDLSPFTRIDFVWQKYGSFHEDIQLNLLCHEVSLMYVLWGAPIQANILKEEAVVSAGDILSVSYRFENGKEAHVSIDRASQEKKKVVTFYSPEMELIWEDEKLYSRHPHETERELIYTAETQALNRECQAFISCIKKGEPATTDARFGAEILRILGLTKQV